MFLVTTSDERTWKTDEKTLFLGEWCRLYNRKAIWSQIDHGVAPYHWDDRERLHRDFKYLEGVYESYLALLVDKLNSIHGCCQSNRYWRIVIGPWLRYFIEVLYDRYLSIAELPDSKKITSTYLLQVDPWSMVPDTVRELYSNSDSDHFNGFLYAEIIKFLQAVPYEIIAAKNPSLKSPPASKSIAMPGMLLKVLQFYSKLLPDRLKRVVFFASGFGELNMALLSLKLSQIPFWVPNIIMGHTEVDRQLRKQLQISTGRGDFEQLLDSLLHLQIPKIYLEGFQKIRNNILQVFPKQPKIILTANGYNSNDIFKIWAAEKTAKDAKLVIAQHGGNFGMALWGQSEDHQVAIADKFYIWGRPNRSENHLQQMSAGKLLRAKKNLVPSENGKMYMVLAELPRTSYWMYSIPVASQFLNYIEDQIAFLQNLDEQPLNDLKLRLFPSVYGWGVKERLVDSGFGNIIEKGRDPFLTALNRHKLCISTYNSTTYLETFVADYPTIIFWNPNHWELRPQAQPYFDSLKNVGILHDTPQTAAKLINQIYDNPGKWWRQPHVQEAKNRFCSAFVKADDKWLNEWAVELGKMC
ncbi:MAG: hypothetical protein HQL69_06585 [Magnetococcales bacterium]|nr:hypothetical protein [Magnetococcales bacterium]